MTKKFVSQGDQCSSGKRSFDKKGAISFRNMSTRLHHMAFQEYPCKLCGSWHLTTVSKNKKNHFRHNI